MTTRSWQPQVRLETIIDQPLSCRQGTNHEDPGGQTTPQAGESNLSIHTAHSFHCALSLRTFSIQLGHEDIGRVRDGRGTDTCDVATEEGDTGLLDSAVGLLGLTEAFVDLLDSVFEGCEFDHGVWDLTTCLWLADVSTVQVIAKPTPQRIQSLIQPSKPLLLHNLSPSLPQRGRIRRKRSLHPDLDRLERTQEQIRQKLSTSTGTQVHDRLVHVGKHPLAVLVLEDLVEPVLSGTLEAVSDESWGPAEHDASNAFGFVDLGPGLRVGLVECGINLATTFYEIEGCD